MKTRVIVPKIWFHWFKAPMSERVELARLCAAKRVSKKNRSAVEQLLQELRGQN